MLGSPLLGTAVGLVLLFATTALLCSGVTETLSNFLELRAKYLLTGLRAMLDGPETEARGAKDGAALHREVKHAATTRTAADAVRDWTPGDPDELVPSLTVALFDSPLLTSLQSRRIGLRKKGRLRNPQYLSSSTFARALIDLLVPPAPDGGPPIALSTDTIRAAVEKLPCLPLRRQLLSFLATAGHDLGAFERALEQWYDDQMAKMTGWYKRWSRVVLGIVGLLIAALANIDTLHVAESLYVDAPLQQAVVATASAGTLCLGETDVTRRNACANQELSNLQAGGTPVGGWPDAAPRDLTGWAFKILGWGITAFAVSFGAPFWFEALSKLGSLRSAGKRPDDS